MKKQGEDHADHRGQCHALELDVTQFDCHAADADDQYNGGKGEVGWFGIIDFGFNQYSVSVKPTASVAEESGMS